MTGLFKNNFYAVSELMKIMLSLSAAAGILLLVSGSPELLTWFTILPAPAAAVVSVFGLQRESRSQWSKYKLTLPVRRADILKSQYLTHTLWAILAMTAVSAVIGGTVLIHGNLYFYYGFRDAVTLVSAGGVIALLIGALSYPLHYLMNEDKAVIVPLLSTLGSVIIVLGLSALVSALSNGRVLSDQQYYKSLGLIIAITVIIYFLSFFLSVRIFRRKEY